MSVELQHYGQGIVDAAHLSSVALVQCTRACWLTDRTCGLPRRGSAALAMQGVLHSLRFCRQPRQQPRRCGKTGECRYGEGTPDAAAGRTETDMHEAAIFDALFTAKFQGGRSKQDGPDCKKGLHDSFQAAQLLGGHRIGMAHVSQAA